MVDGKGDNGVLLENVRDCNEQFVTASGDKALATKVGDLRVRATAGDGSVVEFVVRNVRWVPAFAYTLLSVQQLWREQRVDVRFADTNALVLPPSVGGQRIPFASGVALPTLRLASATAPDAAAAAAASEAPGADAALLAALLARLPGGDEPSVAADAADAVADDSALSAIAESVGADAKQLLALLSAGSPDGGVESAVPPPSGRSAAPLGFHRVGATSHVARLSAAQASELLHRRSHLGVGKLRATAYTTTDAPKVLASAAAVPASVADAAARIKRAPHSGKLPTPAAEPGTLHVDLKELVLSHGNYRYVVFAIDEHTRYVFIEFIKVKSEAAAADCAYNTFLDALAKDWEIVDEGPMEDLLGIEVDYLPDGGVKLHQQRYVQKLVERFLPDGPSPKVERNTLPYSKSFLENVNAALSQSSTQPEHPELVRALQERVGSLMYLAVSTRPDIAYPVHQLCKCLQKPTPALLRECDHVFSYLARHASVGLTYTKDVARLVGYADASWETSHSTSGWVVLWRSAALSWGSRKQKSIALSSCEAEIIALSEAAKDVVYLRKLVSGLGEPEPDPTSLYTDSQSARDVSYNPEHHDRMKHVARRHFFVRDMVESFELNVPFVRTVDNIADFFTKPMKSATQFYKQLRAIIMNEPHATA